MRDRLGARRLAVDEGWGAPADFVRGFSFHVLGAPGAAIEVAGFDAQGAVLDLAADAPAEAVAGAVFEIRSGDEAPVLAARMVTGTAPGQPLPELEMRLATTRGTNALLERRGADVALFVTRGFGDLLLIGDQRRPEIFALCIERPAPIYAHVIEVAERLAADGSVLVPIDAAALKAEARRLVAAGVRGAAVALLHGYRNPAHEQAVAAALREAGFDHVACSADLAPLIKLLPRAETALVEAYLAPVMKAYLAAVTRGSGARRLHVLTSAGGLVEGSRANAKDMLLSGPAGGVAGAAAAGRRSGFARVIGFDMGGTSTDVARFDGDFEYRYEHAVGGVRLAAPALAIETVAAGGGSVCDARDGVLQVGPTSAGADPGPACYGAGGPLTLTDCNVLLGRLDPGKFQIPIDPQAARAALEALGAGIPAEALLEGFLRIANERMAGAIAEVSLARGYDPREYALVAFGGAGGQHACAVAAHLGIETVIMPADASLLSAVGLGEAVVERFAARQVLRPLDDVEQEMAAWLDELAARAAGEVAAEGVAAGEIRVRRRIVNLRLLGQDATIPVEARPDELRSAFAARYRSVYGHEPEGRPVEVESIRVVCSSKKVPGTVFVEPPDAPRTASLENRARHLFPPRSVRAFLGGRWQEVPEHERERLEPGAVIRGPALVVEARSALVLEPGWEASVDGAGAIVARRVAGRSTVDRGAPDEVQEQLFANRFASIAAQMGRMLERTALSTNVKERLDFSCAILDADGGLVVNAPHIPVHLGALGVCVRAVAAALPMGPGDVAVTNHPALGGSHLPDVTVISPVHHGARRIGYVASRAHHAEIGGVRPGSMPPLARSLAEEGVVIRPRYLVRDGRARYEEIERLLAGGPCPSRAVAENLADLRAQVAANRHGVEALARLAADHGAETVCGHMEALTARARRLAAETMARLPAGAVSAATTLDDGTPIRVSIDLRNGLIDFTGSGAVHAGNLNATPAIVRSCVLYVIRLLVGEALPLNEGLMSVCRVVTPEGLLNPVFPEDPAAAPAVGGGNVETSQRIVDVLLDALGLAASSQGTMNNLLVGDDSFSYYETICGGAGATPHCDGADAVHTHMTNTRMTDPEIVEHRYPIRVLRFAIRRGSGGGGAHRGGDGAVRELEFLAPLSVSIVSQRRTQGPGGLAGGGSGAPGRQQVTRADGRIEDLGPVDGAEVSPGDRLIIETPGGGGWGKPCRAGFSK